MWLGDLPNTKAGCHLGQSLMFPSVYWGPAVARGHDSVMGARK